MPPNTVSVTRPGAWGNPLKVGVFFRLINGWNVWTWGTGPEFGNLQVESLEQSLVLFREYATYKHERHKDWLEPLRGKDLACWCEEGSPCHADILLELANQ